MSTGFNLFLAGVAVVVMCVTAVAAAKRQGGAWNYFHFDGRAFIAGQSSDNTPFVAVRTGARPVVVTAGTQIVAVDLASGTGALAGICYIQSSGGKLAHGPAYLPCPRMPVRISAGGRVAATTETDEQGYFLATLAPGRYRVGDGAGVEVTVENGTTTLVPLRAGKKMVD